jgi:excisionase family DNA binding protein
MNRLITIEELAQTLGVSKSYIYRCHYEGKNIPGRVNIGRRTVRYDAKKVEEWLNEIGQ